MMPYIQLVTELSDLQRLELATEVYKTFYNNTNTFEGDIGMHLSYLLGAILEKDLFCLDPNQSAHSDLVDILNLFPAEHLIWKFIIKSEW